MSAHTHKRFSLFPRKLAKGSVWYYYTYNEFGVRQAPRSTGIRYTREKDKAKSRREAEAYLETLDKHHLLEVEAQPTLAEFVADMHFWDFSRSRYVRAVLARSPADRPGITESFCSHAASITRNHILPHHGHKKMDRITPADCEALLFRWLGGSATKPKAPRTSADVAGTAAGSGASSTAGSSGVSNKTANNRRSVYSTIMDEWERSVKMKNPRAEVYNPWRIVRPLTNEKRPFGALSLAEGRRLLDLEAFPVEGERDRIYFLAMKTAALAGLRIGEVCGLWAEDVIDRTVSPKKGTSVRMSYLSVSRQYNARTKKRTLLKDKDVRAVPIMSDLRDELEPLLIHPTAYLFSLHPRQEHPITANRLREWAYKRMDTVKIEDREERNITFHSFRRFFNTVLRHQGVADAVVQRFTGHASADMSEHYTDYLPEDMQSIAAAQARIFSTTETLSIGSDVIKEGSDE